MKIPNYILFIILIGIVTLSGCQSTTEQYNQKAQRGTLGALAQARTATEPAAVTITKIQREKKLAKLYQSILTLEPNEEVRAQVTYRLVQIDTQLYHNSEYGQSNENETHIKEEQLGGNNHSLNTLVLSYEDLLKRFPGRTDNEHIQYQLAKALYLQGKLDKSLLQIELLLEQYPQSKYAAELHFRRGDIYYSLQFYSKALVAYQAVLTADNNQAYYVNSMYMLGWTLFKLNRLPEADSQFIALLDHIVTQEKIQPYEGNFSFNKLASRYQGILTDIQRVLNISLSQQQQSTSLLALLTQQKTNKQIKHLNVYQYILFNNLASFLIKNDLKYDAELTYQAYITLNPNSLWASRFCLDLLKLYQQQGKNNAALKLQEYYVNRYGLTSPFWQKAMTARSSALVNERVLVQEVLPNLLSFSYQHSRRLYAKAQQIPTGSTREHAFVDVANWLSTYLSLAKLEQSEALLNDLHTSQGILSDELLYADARFEAKQLQQALTSYELIAYEPSIALRTLENEKRYLDAAYATTVTVRAMLTQLTHKPNNKEKSSEKQRLISMREQLDRKFIGRYPMDLRSLVLATQGAQVAFNISDYQSLNYYTNFILQSHGVALISTNISTEKKSAIINKADLNVIALKQVRIATQLQANSFYRQKNYQIAEQAYSLALKYVDRNSESRKTMRNLLASSVYFQAQQAKEDTPLVAVEHYLRLGVRIPESSYRIAAQFDAANILLAQAMWRQAVDVLLPFQKEYPKHEYTASIPAKLANAYEQLKQWQLAAAQLLIMTQGQASVALKREAQYSAAEYYLKAGNLPKAIVTFRAYAHAYPEPFDVAQEVRFKMSEFYKQIKEPNKQYYWYRKLISFHDKAERKAKQPINVRSTYLASVAALGLGQAHQQTFTWTKLNLPLNKSLKRKQKSMEIAIDYYQKLLSYQRAEFVPQGTFNLAQMYKQLADDVMSSQRPKDLDEFALEEYELILEEIAYPFEDKSIEIHASNAKRAWQNTYDVWVEKSFSILAELEPAQFNKKEREIDAIHALH